MHPVRAKTESVRDLSKKSVLLLPVLDEFDRPQVRSDCRKVTRPCPFVGCSMNLYLEVNEENGSMKLVFPDREPDQMPAESSCALDVAEDFARTLEETGEFTNLTRERVRQIENEAIEKIAPIIKRILNREDLDR